MASLEDLESSFSNLQMAVAGRIFEAGVRGDDIERAIRIQDRLHAILCGTLIKEVGIEGYTAMLQRLHGLPLPKSEVPKLSVIHLLDDIDESVIEAENELRIPKDESFRALALSHQLRNFLLGESHISEETAEHLLAEEAPDIEDEEPVAARTLFQIRVNGIKDKCRGLNGLLQPDRLTKEIQELESNKRISDKTMIEHLQRTIAEINSNVRTIYQLNISSMSLNTLQRAGITTIEELDEVIRSGTLTDIPRLGSSGRAEIGAAYQSYQKASKK